MSYSIRHTGPAIDEEDLRQVEAKIATDLPAAYREMLLRHNGGIPDPNGFLVGDPATPYSDSDVCYFFKINAEALDEDLIAEYQYMVLKNSRIPRGYLPIGADSGGNRIVLKLQDKGRGSVWFWDHERETEDNRGLIEIAPDLQHFLDALT